MAKSRKKSSVEELWESQASGNPKGPARLLHNPAQEKFRAYAVEAEPPLGRAARRVRLCYPLARLYANGVKVMVPWTVEKLLNYLQSSMPKIRRAYRGAFTIHIEPVEPRSDPIEGNLSAPPLPEMQGTPQEAPPVTTASRESLDNLHREREPGEEG